MENKNKNNKKFYRNQKFYVSLVVGLCVIAAITVVTMRNLGETQNTNTAGVNEKVTSDETKNNNEDKKENSSEDSQSTETTVDNAEFVDANSQSESSEDDGYVVVKTDELLNKEEAIAVSSSILNDLKNPVDGKKIYDFRNGRIGVVDKTDNVNKTPRGIGISAVLGTDVKASADGEIEYVGFEGKYGNLVVIKHGDSLKTVYANLDEKVAVKEGQKVKCGEVIGKVGKTAAYFANENEYAPHLHFEVIAINEEYKTVMENYNKYFDSFVDPAKYLKLEK